MNMGERLVVVNGRPTGLDYMRILLSVAVVCWHSIVTSYGNEAQDAVQAGPWRAAITFILPMFFCLSGFLVAGSLERCKSLVGFMGLRFIRIYPALAVEVFLSALVLGPIITTFSLADYFTDHRFFEYLINVTGHIHYQLPGVFLNNPNPDRVNGQLWTVPYELMCYIAIAGLAALGLAKHRNLYLAAAIALWAVGIAAFMYRHGFGSGRGPTSVPGFILVIAFLGGNLMYFFRDKIAFRADLAIAAAVSTVIISLVPIYGDFLMPLPISYLTVYLGLLNPRKIGMLKGADYSYGIFLYGYVIQQAWMSVSPSLHHWWINLALTLPTATAFAAFSWHYVEKPALKMRAGVKWAEDHWLRHRHKFVVLLPNVGGLRRPERTEINE